MQVECQQDAEQEGQLTLTLQQQTVNSDSEVSDEAAQLGHMRVNSRTHVELSFMILFLTLIEALISGLFSGSSIRKKLFEQDGL